MAKRNYNLTPQETTYFCMASVCQAILRRHNALRDSETQQTIAERLKCTPEHGVIFGKDMSEFFHERNLFLNHVQYNEVFFKEPEILVEEAFECDTDVILGSLNGGGLGHVVLVTDYEKDKLEVLDPKDAGHHYLSLEKLYSKMWNDEFGTFGLVTNPRQEAPTQQI